MVKYIIIFLYNIFNIIRYSLEMTNYIVDFVHIFILEETNYNFLMCPSYNYIRVVHQILHSRIRLVYKIWCIGVQLDGTDSGNDGA
jgi:hypothetical protein